MSILSEYIVEKFIACSTKEKEAIGSAIVISLGGDIKKYATGLHVRKGNQDGGIDGRIPIRYNIRRKVERPDGTYLFTENTEEIEAVAAFCVKIETKKFDRYYLNAFIQDMNREKIFHGIIITARELSQDAQSIFKMANDDKQYKLYHFRLADIIEGNYYCDLSFKIDLKTTFETQFSKYLSSEK